MKKANLIYSMFAMTLCVAFTSCSKNDSEPVIGPNVKIERTENNDTSRISVILTPDKDVERYTYMLGTANDFQSFAEDTNAEIIAVEGDEPTEAIFEDLDANNTYTVYAKAFKNGSWGGVATLKVKTKDNGFDVKLQYTTEQSAGFKVFMSPNWPTCRYHFGTAEDKDSFINGTIEGEYLNEVIDYQAVNFFGLEQKEYVFYAIGFDRLGTPTELYEIPVNTAATEKVPVTEEPEIDIDVYRGYYKIKGGNGCAKISCVVSAVGQHDGLVNGVGFKGDRLYWVDSWSQTKYGHAATGNLLEFYEDDVEFKLGTEMEAYVVAYGDDMVPACVRRYTFKKPDYDESIPKPHVEISIDKITSTGGTYTYTPDENTLGFFYNTLDADWYDELVKTDPYVIHMMLFESGEYYAYKGELDNGKRVYEETTGKPGIRYYAVACPFNANGPTGNRGWGDMTMAEYTSSNE